MSLWVNENGVMKEISIDREDMSTIRFFTSDLKFFTFPSTRNYFKPSELGITKAIKTEQQTNENTYAGTWYSPARPSNINPEYIFTIKHGKFPFKIPKSCKYSIPGTYGGTNIYTSFSDWNRSTFLYSGGGSISSTHYAELAIRFILEDGENYKIDAYCYYYSISEATALTTNMYAYASTTIGSQPAASGYACNVYGSGWPYIIDAVDVLDYTPEDSGITL